MRDVLQSALENAKVNPNIVSILLAHKVKGVDKHYSNHDYTELKEAFKSALPWLLPKSVEQITVENNKTLAKQQLELEKLQFRCYEAERKLSYFDKFFPLTSAVETESDAQRLLDFLEELRKEKIAKEHQEEMELREEITKEINLDKITQHTELAKKKT
jgi:hypothetical protein